MSRRRPLRRPPRFRLPGRRRPPLPPGPRRALARANRLMVEQRFLDAADIFERLSGQARQRGMLVRAANLTLQTSRARFAASDVESALDRARKALQLFVRAGRPERVPPVLGRMTAALREQGYESEADRLEQEVEQALGQVGLSLDQTRQRTPRVPEKRGSLPARCGGCGAPLVPDEVEWHDAHTAECPYCGAVVKATSLSPR